MEISLPLKDMSLSDKMRVMESLWQDLGAEGSGFEPPAWHGSILQERQVQYDAGEIEAADWESAKARIRDSVS
jgi:hypothetical protein